MRKTKKIGSLGYQALTDAEWGAEKRAMETLDTSLAGRRILVADVAPEEKGELGYTSRGSVIHIAREHEYYQQFDKKEAAVFRFGVNTHEALHQVYTDFDSFYAMADVIPGALEKEMFAQIFNLIEDPAIENFADQVVGGFALDALYFTIEKIYEAALPVSGPQNHGQALEEYFEALIQFGDRGIIKGGFSSAVAREYFNRTAPIIYKAINEPDGHRRVELALEIYRIVKPLWSGKQASKAKQAIGEITKRYAKTKTGGSGKGKAPQKAGDARNARRKNEIRKQKKQEEEVLEKEAAFASGTGGADTQTEEKNNGKNSYPQKKAGNPREEDARNQESSADNDFSGENAEGEEKGLGSGRNPGDNGPVPADKQNDNSPAGQPDSDGDDGPVFQYDPQIANKFAEAMKEFMEHGKTGNAPDPGTEKPEAYKEAIQSENQQFFGVKEKNVIPPCEGMTDRYSDILDMAAWITGPLITQLKKIFTDDRGGKVYTQRGKISMKRAASGKATTRMFERRVLPGDKADMCLILLIDLSGSMNGAKEQAAKLSAMVLSEAFAYFKIPIYCMGFQSVHGIDAYQTHFVRWRNTVEERMSILSASPSGNNFDSYSIRYAAEALKKRPEKHKLMCVISDGIPSHYFTHEVGIRENAKAIRDARLLKINVFGIGIGTYETAKFQEMYGKDYFINVIRPDDLAGQAADLVKRVVRNW